MTTDAYDITLLFHSKFPTLPRTKNIQKGYVNVSKRIAPKSVCVIIRLCLRICCEISDHGRCFQ